MDSGGSVSKMDLEKFKIHSSKPLTNFRKVTSQISFKYIFRNPLTNLGNFLGIFGNCFLGFSGNVSRKIILKNKP